MEASLSSIRVWGVFLQHSPNEGTSSQNSVLLHNLCRRVCEPQLSYMDTTSYEGCVTVHLPHEIKWNANLMQLGNFIDVFLAPHVSGTYANHQEHKMLSCSIWFSAPSFWIGGGLESRCVGRVYGADGAVHHLHRRANHSKRSSIMGHVFLLPSLFVKHHI